MCVSSLWLSAFLGLNSQFIIREIVKFVKCSTWNVEIMALSLIGVARAPLPNRVDVPDHRRVGFTTIATTVVF